MFCYFNDSKTLPRILQKAYCCTMSSIPSCYFCMPWLIVIVNLIVKFTKLKNWSKLYFLYFIKLRKIKCMKGNLFSISLLEQESSQPSSPADLFKMFSEAQGACSFPNTPLGLPLSIVEIEIIIIPLAYDFCRWHLSPVPPVVNLLHRVHENQRIHKMGRDLEKFISQLEVYIKTWHERIQWLPILYNILF